MPEHEPDQQPDVQPSPERAPSALESFPYRLGIEHTTALTTARETAIEAAKGADADVRRESFIALWDILEHQVRAQPEDSDRPPSERRQLRAEVGMNITKALIWHEAGDMGRYLEDLEEIEWGATGYGMDDVSAAIGDEFTRLDTPDRTRNRPRQ